MSLFMFQQAYGKPNSIENTDKDNDIQYHADYGKYCISNSGMHESNTFYENIKINKRFYKGDQWSGNEDIESFLKDETGQVRNRIQIVHNQIRPLIEQYRGNAIRMIVNARAEAKGSKAVNRREQKLAEKLFKFTLAQEVESFSKFLIEKYSLGATEAETKQIFDNQYVDEFAEAITQLIKYIAEVNDFEQMKPKMAENMGLSGMAVVKAREHAGHLRFQNVESERFGWDRSARRDDLQDAGWMYDWDMLLPTQIYEMWPDVSLEAKKAIENYVSGSGSTFQEAFEFGLNPTHVPVFNVFWKDSDRFKMGYVKDEFGYPFLTKIDYIYPNEKKPRYTEKDLISPPDTPKNKKRFKGRKFTYSSLDVIRYCTLIPSDVLALNNQNDKAGDIVLDYGVYELQDTEYEDPANARFPYMAYCWSYVDGEVSSPVDDAIDPQRFINRVLSAIESQINQSGGSNTIYDKDAVDAQEGEDQLIRDINAGRPVGLRSKGRGIQNVVSSYDASPKQGVYKMFDLIGAIKGLIQETTGVNEALKGESIGQDQLVGVTQMLLQRGSLMQEPFYYAIQNIYMQMYRYAANMGKKVYIENERDLAIMVGDHHSETIRLSGDMKIEDFRVFVVRDNIDEVSKAYANQTLMQLYQMQLIDDKILGQLYGRSTEAEVARYLRQYSRDKIEAAKKQMQNQQASDQQAMAQMEQIQNKMDQRELMKKAAETQLEMTKDDNAAGNKVSELMAQKMSEPGQPTA